MPGMSAGGSPTDVRIALFGGFGATLDGNPVEDRWRLRKAKTLIKLLALAPGHRLHRDVALETLWPDADPTAAANNLHQAVHAARRVLGAERVALRDDVLLLAPDDDLHVDVEIFERLAERARTSGEVGELRAALREWTGPLLPEDAYDEWIVPHRERLEATHAALSTMLATRLVDVGEPNGALALLEPLAAHRALDEPLQRVRMTALDALGRRWDAIEAYEQLRGALETEYAADPDPETKALYRRLLAGAAPQPGSAPHNLPEPVSSFVGRERELNELDGVLHRTRLLTLTGPGGAGKSRLALELARRVSATDRFADGVWLVELAGVQDPELVTSATAAALDLPLPGGKPSHDALTSQLAGRSLLLLLDNCEHVLAEASAMVTEVLRRCPDVSIATTSREPLALPGESVYRVPSLELPAAREDDVDVAALLRLEAVQLFVERARQSVPAFVVEESNGAAIAEVCFRLDGMPLALELAAARLAHLTVADLADALTDALTVLARRGGARLDRQQTLAATLDWSHQLLDADEQLAFRRLAVFAGGFELSAARHVCGLDAATTVELISRLVDKSLVEADTAGVTARYRLLEVVRQYADARLEESGDEQTTRRRHREWYAAAAAEHDPDRGPVVGVPSRWFDVEQDNLRAALASALTDAPAIALHLAVATWRFLMARGLIDESARWLTRALERCPEPSSMRARALAGLAVLRVRQGRLADMHAIGNEIVDVLDAENDPVAAAHARHQRALLAFIAGDWAAAASGEVSLGPSADLPAMHAVTASAQHLAGVIALSRGDGAAALEQLDAAHRSLSLAPAAAPPYFVAVTIAWTVDERADPPLLFGEDTLLVGRRIGTEQAVAHVAVAAALARRLAGDSETALALLDDATARFVALEDQYGTAYAAAQRGHTLRWAGDFAAADEAFAESERLRRAMRDHRAVAMTLGGRALAAAAAGGGDKARSWAREAVQMMERSGDNPGVALTATDLGTVELLLGDRAAASGWFDRAAELSEMPGGHRAYGWVRLVQAWLHAEAGDVDFAVHAISAAEQMFRRIGELQGLSALQRARKVVLPSVARTGDR